MGQGVSGAVTGRVTQAESGDPVPAAEVLLKGTSDSTTVARARSSFDGRFRLSGVREGSYFVEIASLGYGTRTTEPFEVDAGIVYAFGHIKLSVAALALDPIRVVSAREAVSHETDRTSYLLDGLPAAQGGDLADALRTLSELDVDFDGNVELRGEEPALWLNGRPAPMTGQALAQFLEQFPADLVDRIEVIDNPSSEFDAEGTGGIVNIVLEEGADLGLNGNVFANIDTGGSTGLGGQGTLQRGDWVWDGSLSVRRREAETEGFSLRQNLRAEPTEFVRRDTWNASRSLGADVNFRTRYTPLKEARISMAANYSGQDRERDGLVTRAHMDEARDPFLRYDRASRSDADRHSLDLRTGFEWRWAPGHHFADLELRYMRRSNYGEAREEVEDGADLEPSDLAPAELTLEDDERDDRELRLDLRYRHPLGEQTSFSTGYSLRDRTTANERVQTLVDPVEHPEGEATTRGFGRSQTLHSAYITVERDVAEGLVIQGGFRAEHVDWALQFPTTAPVRGRYFDAFPSANIAWNLGRTRRLRLSYAQRTSRPPVSVLNPTDRSTDPLERVVGNPEIEPRYTHRVNLDGSWSGDFGTLSAGPYVSRSANGWERIATVDQQGISTRTWDNLSSETSTGLSLSYSFRNLGSWRGSANVSGSRAYRDADHVHPHYSGSYTSWNAHLNLNGRIYGGLTGQASLRYRGASQGIQGRTSAQASADLSFRHRFMEDRLLVSLSLRDPFGLRQRDREIRDRDVWEIRGTSQSTRSAQLSVSYALGGGGR